MYQIEFRPAVTKDLQKIEKKFLKSIFRKIETLKTNPYQQNLKRLTVSHGVYFRIRAGDYRIVFAISDRDRKIIIHYIRDRKEAYRGL